MGSCDADATLLCSSGVTGCLPTVFRALYAERPCQTLQLYLTQIVISNCGKIY